VSEDPREIAAAQAVANARMALKMTCAALPYLSGLAQVAKIIASEGVPTAAVTRTGRVFVNPRWFGSLNLTDATFVIAHELMHLCLESHERGIGTDHKTFNYAHDYIINDILTEELGRRPPAGGLEYRGARELSAEMIVAMMKRGQVPSPRPQPRSEMRAALEDAGLLNQNRPDMPGSDDVMSDDEERALVPDADPVQQEIVRGTIRTLAATAQSLAKLKEKLDAAGAKGGGRGEAGGDVAIAEALRSRYAPPWEMALQQWMEAAAPGPRSYAKASRRGAANPDIVFAGRQRIGWMLHIILDTSGSMVDEIPRALGLIAAFCEAVNVEQVHVLQCDQTVTVDEYVELEGLLSYKVAGFGGSDMSVAMLRLAADPEVRAAIVITDGEIAYPQEAVPYEVLWAITNPQFPEESWPPYGRVILMPPGETTAET
jgi:predicted metal-dependent peptidase